MKLFKRKPAHPEIKGFSGIAKIPSACTLVNDEEADSALAFPEMPDFAALAVRHADTARAYPTFHQKGMHIFTGEMVNEYRGYASRVAIALRRYTVELQTVHAASIEASINDIDGQLADLHKLDKEAKREKVTNND